MVPIAIGSQTNGSTIRPAAYCGVVGFKPTHGLISRHGVFALSRTLDHVGLFANSVDDIALLAEQIVSYDENDLDTSRARGFHSVKLPPRSRRWRRCLRSSKHLTGNAPTKIPKKDFAEVVDHLGSQVEEVELFLSAADAWQWHHTIMGAEMAHNLEHEWTNGRDLLSEQLRAQIERGQEVRAMDYQRALSRINPMHESFVELFEQRYDAILTPAAPSAAPKGLAATGDPSFCTLWTLCGMPCISLPLLQSTSGLPIGVQLVGPRHGDARLLRTARWLAAKMAES